MSSPSDLIKRNSGRKYIFHAIIDQNDVDDVSESANSSESHQDQQYELLSKPILSENSTFNENALEYVYSFGYDCKKLYNLCLIDNNTLVFGSGTLIHFFNITTGSVSVRRTSRGTGIGFITKNPNPDHLGFLTVAENGRKPPITVYHYPEMSIISTLHDDTPQAYTALAYSSDGKLMASQSGEPDYTITIWDWKKSQVILRAKAFSNDILTVIFSPHVPGHLTTSGVGHLKFWKMSETFTGLKLKGALGRFGKTEICDILGVCPMPDEKVLSGCDWGNMLVWDEGLIKYEVCRKSRKKLHSQMITQIEMHGDEVMTTSLDGYVRIWFWPSVEMADPPDDDLFVEIEPIFEYRIGSETHLCEIVWMIKKNVDTDNDYKWYIQDGNGGIWIADITPDHTPEPPKQLFRCHAGEILGLDTSPCSHHVATLGYDGRLYIYDYMRKKLLFYKQFPSKGSTLVWLPFSIDPSGSIIIMGFEDGVIRMVFIDFDPRQRNLKPISLVQVIKSHSKSITKFAINPTETILVSGSHDNTIFIHQLFQQEPFVKIIPIGLLSIDSPCTALNWKPDSLTTILIGCMNGEILEAELPERPRSYTKTTYNLAHINIRRIVFKSVKSEIRRENQIKENERVREIKLAEKMKDLDKLKRENPGIVIDEKEFLSVEDSEDTIDPLYIPPEPNRILWLKYTSRGTIWVSMAGYDAGYIYEYNFEHENPVCCTIIPQGDDIEINSYIELDQYLIFGMNDGVIRVNSITDDYRYLDDFILIPMHDNSNGNITSLKFSCDKKFLFSAGSDGNLFMFKWNLPTTQVFPEEPIGIDEQFDEVEDIFNPDYLSLEQQKQKDDNDVRLKISQSKKDKVLKVLDVYKSEFLDIQDLNIDLIPSQRLTAKDLELDARITDDLNQSLESDMSLVKRKLEYDVEKSILGCRKLKEYFINPLESFPTTIHGLCENTSVRTFRIRKLAEEFYSIRGDLDERIELDAKRRRVNDEESSNGSERVPDEMEDIELKDDEIKAKKLESFLEGLTESTIEFRLETKMRRLLNKYRERKNREEQRKLEWDYLNSIKPDPNVDHPDDVEAIKEAEKTIGDYKLKMDPNYVVDEQTCDTTLKKFDELLRVRQEIFDIRHSFNIKVLQCRDEKDKIINYFNSKMEKLNSIHAELPISDRKLPKLIAIRNMDDEYPERNYETEAEVKRQETIHDRKSIDVIDENMLSTEHLMQSVLPTTIEKTQINVDEIKQHLKLNYVTIQDSMTSDDDITPWEMEQQQLKLDEALFQQAQIIKDLNRRIENFDNNLKELKESRIEYEVNTKFLDNYLLTINQELWILKDFEYLEQNFVNKIEQKWSEKYDIHSKISTMKGNIENYRANIERFNEEETKIQEKFLAQCSHNKFFDFLRRIFKRKYKPVNMFEHDDNAENSSSSESDSSSEDDAGDGKDAESFNSLDIGPIRLDESKCPPGCDPKLYELTFYLRQQRHTIEENIKTESNLIEECKKNIEVLHKSIKVVDVDLEKCKEELAVFRRERQKALNEVETLVVIKMNQIQHFRTEAEFKDIGNALLFNNSNVAKLYSRVNQLATETLEAKRQHRVNIIHLSRMKTDCKFMEQQIVSLKDEIQEAMIKKFGIIVSLDEVEEAILARMVFEIKGNVDDVMHEYNLKISDEKKKIIDIQVKLNRQIQEGTEKLNILTVLQEENNYLHEALLRQNHLIELQAITTVHHNFNRDVNKLKDISRQQKEQINILQREIRTLSLKSKPFETVSTTDYRFNNMHSDGAKPYEESVYSALADSINGPAHEVGNSSPHDSDILNEAIKLIKRFLMKHFIRDLPERELRKRSHTIGRFFVSHAENFDHSQAEDFYNNVIENLKISLPKDKQGQLDDNEIISIFMEIVNRVHGVDTEVNSRELILEILEQVHIEITEFDSENYTQEFITEILKQVIISLPTTDILDIRIMEFVVSELSKVKSISAKCVDTTKVVTDVIEYAAINYIEEIDLEMVKNLVDILVNGLLAATNKREVRIDITEGQL